MSVSPEMAVALQGIATSTVQAGLQEPSNRIAQLEQFLTDARTEIDKLRLHAKTAEEEHRNTHGEMAQMKAQLQAVQSMGGGKGEFRLIDPKTMAPGILGSAGGPHWRKWSENTRAYVENLSQKLAQQSHAAKTIL